MLCALVAALFVPAHGAWSAFEADISTDEEEPGTPPAVEVEVPSIEPEPPPVATEEPPDPPDPHAPPEPAPPASPVPEADATTPLEPTPATVPTAEPNDGESGESGEPGEPGEVMISASIPQDADPGSTVTYRHTLTHLGDEPAAYAVSTGSSLGWSVALFAEDGVTPLLDDQGTATSGLLAPGEAWTIVVAVAVPEDAPAGAEDTTTTTVALSHLPDHVLDIIRDRTRVRSRVTLRLHSRQVKFGDVSPDGRLGPRQWNVSVVTDDGGAFYVMENAVGVTVFSNTSWTGGCRAEENTGTATTIRIADGDLAWRLPPSPDWVAFTPAPLAVPYDNSCFPTRDIGANTYRYDLRLRITWDDDPGTFESRVIFEASA